MELSNGDSAELDAKIQFAKDMLIKFKAINISQGINAIQSLWLHERVRKWNCTVSGVSFEVDIVNMAMSGDIETTCIAMMYGQPDEMNHPKHWLTQEKMDYLINSMKEYLGWV